MKRKLSVLVIAALILNMIPVPVNAALSITNVTDQNMNPISSGVYGDLVYVFGDGVISGLDVNLYWDIVTAWDGEQGLLNSSIGQPSGAFEIWFEVPEAVKGSHYLWIRDSDTPSHTDGPVLFTVNPSMTVTPRSGIKNDPVTINGYGFGDEVDVDPIEFDGSPLTTNPSVPVTDGVGSWEATFNVPDITDADYDITAEDEDANTASVSFKVGPAMTLDLAEGSVGTVVEITGRGFTSSGTVTSVTLDDIVCKVLDTGDMNINSNGAFTLEFVIPSVGTADKEYILEVTDSGAKSADMDFLVTNITTIELELQFGGPGSRIGITGHNFAAISGLSVVIKFDGTTIETLYTNSNGDISGTIMIPAKSYGNYQVEAEQGIYNIQVSEGFRVGAILTILAPITGPTGTRVTLTGIGFTPSGKWDAYFGGVSIFEDEDVSGDTTLSGFFYIPTVESGEHTLTVVDLDADIEVEAAFTVTESTSLSFDPESGPVGFNVSVEGMYFAESTGGIGVDFVIYNSTGDWAMDVYEGDGSPTTDEDGAFSAWWAVPDVLSLGSYTVNATDDEGLFSQFAFEVVSKFLSITPHKSAYNRGDPVRFNIESSFEEVGSYIRIFDPEGSFVWQTDDLDSWIEGDITYLAPFYTQTAGGNIMVLGDDAPLGNWTWTWYDSDDVALSSGIFTVEEPTPDDGGDGDDPGDGVTDEVIDELQQGLQGLEEEIAQLSSDLEEALQTIEDLTSSTAESISEIEDTLENTAAGAAESMQDAEEAKTLATEAKSVADEAIDGLDAAMSAADAAKNEADAAKADAEKALNSSSGMTLMVYAALGISLVVAALTFIGPLKITRKPPG
jgi:hypothetical protein